MASKQILNYKVHTLTGETSSETSITLNVKEVNPKYLLHRAVVIQNNNARQGTSSCKTRSEVRGGGKKPWKQKGTGNARAGSSNSPLWKGGGVAFGPKPRSYSKKINNKEWRLALNTAIQKSFDKTIVVEDFTGQIDTPKTKKIAEVLNKIVNITDTSQRTLIILSDINNNVKLSLRNLSNITVLHSNTLNVKDILLAHKILVTDKALKNIQEVYSEN
uniref:Large ribosomal subunit protein uL4c n=1 Tax=Guillardia theta TaxID=55529 RepID=A0A0U2KST5_GUITH|nr:ribosomal protein L4 [Guillardia theta]|tara:strand:+ start:10485 stop:11138 length:654 start_codon:yes stop_codon:yes gene_type:complete